MSFAIFCRLEQTLNQHPFSAEEQQFSLIERFGPYTQDFNYDQPGTDLLLSVETIQAIRTLIAKDNLVFCIISAYPIEYVQKLLEYHQFTGTELHNIIIRSGNPTDAVLQTLDQSKLSEQTNYYFIDNEETTRKQMVAALQRKNYPLHRIKTFLNRGESFHWPALFQDLQAIPQTIPFVSALSTKHKDSFHYEPHYACYKTIGRRSLQEDYLMHCPLTTEELHGHGPKELAARLWSALYQLNARYTGEDGSTASVVLSDGSHLITATLGDSVAFLVAVDKDGTFLDLRRLNTENA